MLQDKLAILISRKLAGEASAEELQELQQHLQQHPEDQYFASLLEDYWQQSSAKEGALPDTGSQEDHFFKILRMAEEEQPLPGDAAVAKELAISRRRRYLLPAAAVLAAVMAGAYFLLHTGKPAPVAAVSAKPSDKNEVVAQRGVRSRLVLPDGSTVWLNAESKLSYSNHFNDSIREVSLEGEAFFDVAKDPARPFVVHTSGIDIRVLGTAFNVKSYAHDSTIETILVQGMVEVMQQNRLKSPRVILHPHEKLVFSKESAGYLPADSGSGNTSYLPVGENDGIVVTALPKNIPDTAIAETSWIYNRLVFDGDTFRELAAKMERWFNVKIRFHDTQAAAYRFRGMFENEDIEHALQALQLTAPFRFTVSGDEVEIFKK